VIVARFFEQLHQLADLLSAAAVGDQQRVGCVDDDQILDA